MSSSNDSRVKSPPHSAKVSPSAPAPNGLVTEPENITNANQVINDTVLNRFIEIQSQIENYEQQGVFERLRLAEDEFERLEKSKRQSEINTKVLTEQTNKEKQDFENISQPTVQSFFKNKQAHNMAISKEQVVFSRLFSSTF